MLAAGCLHKLSDTLSDACRLLCLLPLRLLQIKLGLRHSIMEALQAGGLLWCQHSTPGQRKYRGHQHYRFHAYASYAYCGGSA